MATATLATLNGLLDSALRDPDNETWTSAEKDELLARAVRGLYPQISYPLDPEDFTITLVDSDYFYPLNPAVMSISRVDLVDSDSNELGPLSVGTWETVGRLGGSKTAVLTTSAAADNIIDTTVAHDFRSGDTVRFISLTGGAGLTVGTTYHVISGNLAVTTLQVSATAGGSAVDFTTDITAGVLEGGDGKIHISPVVVDRWATGTVRLNGYGRFDTVGNYIPDEYVELVIEEASAAALNWLLSDRARFLQHGNTRQDQNVSVNELSIRLNTAEQRTRELRSRLFVPRRPMPGRV